MNLKKISWFIVGILLLGISFIGVYLPGLPWSTPAVGAAYCFAKSSERMHRWIYDHPLFGPFLTGWQEKKIFPTRMKYIMLLSMSTSVAIMWFTVQNPAVVLATVAFMLTVAALAWRYPGSEEEHQRRVQAGKKIGWFK